jgi:hypothetical protein
MRDTVRKVNYFSMSVPNKPGQTFRVLATLVSAGINLLGCTEERCLRNVGRVRAIEQTACPTRRPGRI